MFSPLLETWGWVKAHNPLKAITGLKTVRLNFITIHCTLKGKHSVRDNAYHTMTLLDIYILSLAIVGSILIYPAGGLDYIDALFFGSGAATQSGLNTYALAFTSNLTTLTPHRFDINKLSLYQQVSFSEVSSRMTRTSLTTSQVILYFLTMFATPIFINTIVVFVRLYWFERRFQHVVNEARNLRRSRSKSRTKTEMLEVPEVEFKERGVNGRNIVVLHSGDTRKSDRGLGDAHKSLEPVKEMESETPTASSSSSGETPKPWRMKPEQQPQDFPTLHREITFADQVHDPNSLDSPMPRLPQRLSPEQHIAFLENQRNPKDKAMLRIPGPRDFDRGETPEPLSMGEDGEPLDEKILSPVDRKGQNPEIPIKRNVTIEDPKHPRLRTDSNTLANHRTNNTETSNGTAPEDRPPMSRLRSRTGTFRNFGRSNTTQEKDPMPYLSWQPTIGRNSAFVDLTEEQREELGGIEYRSLKTLAIILVCEFLINGLLASFRQLMPM